MEKLKQAHVFLIWWTQYCYWLVKDFKNEYFRFANYIEIINCLLHILPYFTFKQMRGDD